MREHLAPGTEVTISYVDVLDETLKVAQKNNIIIPQLMYAKAKEDVDKQGEFEESLYGVSFVGSRRKEIKKRYFFECNCEECVAAISDVKKHGFDPQVSFYCLKYPNCKGLFHLPLNPELRSDFCADLKLILAPRKTRFVNNYKFYQLQRRHPNPSIIMVMRPS